MMRQTFDGENVFMSRNLVPPEVFDSLHDALKLNGADIFLCCDPSRNGPNDYHIISSRDHEKFDDLRAKGCQLLGPHCVISCAKEHRVLPKQGFTCCLAMDGVKVLASGFDLHEKAEIGKLVTAMGGALQTKASSDISFVIVKNVLATKYKWALNVLKKPIVTLSWLHQCWKEHRVVPQELYKVLPFSGLTISVSKIPADERKEIEKLVIQNGGKYSAELTKLCTHLVCDTPEGDKYKVAKRWGHIHVVTRKWFDLSLVRRACLGEESYPVQSSTSSVNCVKRTLTLQRSQEVENVRCASSSMTRDVDYLAEGVGDPDLEATLSQNITSSFSNASSFVDKENADPTMWPTVDSDVNGCVAGDSQTEYSDLYLSDCRILLVGFDASETRKLVSMVCSGGGSRYMSPNEKLTHIVVGSPSEAEKKEVRGLAAMGVVYVVKTTWLEDCDHERKEVPVLQRHIAYDLLLPKDPLYSSKGVVRGLPGANQGQFETVQPVPQLGQFQKYDDSGSAIPLKNREESESSFIKETNQRSFSAPASSSEGQKNVQQGLRERILAAKSSNVFLGKVFRFSASFPEIQRAEVVQWINQGEGEVVDDQMRKKVHFKVESHGLRPGPSHNNDSIIVSSHWIRACLEEVQLLDVGSHILFSPLPCCIPMPGFNQFLFCVSQYDEKDRLLLKNLCYILGSRLVEKLTKKVTHLICKFASGPKYEAASKWGIQTVTSDWILECVKQNKIVALDSFPPKEATAEDKDAGICTGSQYPTQAVRMISVANASSNSTSLEELGKVESQVSSRSARVSEGIKNSNDGNKKLKLLEDESRKGVLSSSLVNGKGPLCRVNSMRNSVVENGATEVSNSVADVASVIEDLLEQSSKAILFIHDQNLPERTGLDKNLFTSERSIPHQDHTDLHSSGFGLSNHWKNSTIKKDGPANPPEDPSARIYDGFSETQTESQVVGYEEDLSGRQMIIERVRIRSSMT